MHFSRIAIAAGLTATAAASPVTTYGLFGLKPAPGNSTLPVGGNSTLPGNSTIPVGGNTTTPTNSTGLQWVGVNESGADFGSAIPGKEGSDYEWPLNSSIDVLAGKGLNIFRIPFLMERLAQHKMTNPLEPAYLAGLKGVVSHITAAKNYAVVDAHNYGRYPWDNNNGPVINSTSDFKAFWKNVATEFASDSNVIFDCNNEYNGLDKDHNKELEILTSLNQACIDGIRAAGATSQYIFIEGTSWTSALHWIDSGSGDALLDLKDPSDKIVYEMHQYLDDGSGQHAECVSSTIGQERIANATQWLKANKKKAVLGEFAGGDNPTCKTAVTGLLENLVAAKDVWMGAIWWGGGAMWDDGSVKGKTEYVYRMEPPSGVGYKAYADTLAKYVSK